MIFLYPGSCADVLARLPADDIDACVCDPPYGLSKEPDIVEVLTHWLAGDDYRATGGGFMGKTWDSFVPGPAIWREVYRVLKPGGFLLAFGGSKTADLLSIAIRLAGFEVRDTAQWLYGQGFPKSLDISKAIDKAAGAEREVIGKHPRPAANKPGGAAYQLSVTGMPDEATITAPATPEAERWNGWGTALKPAFEPIIVARKPLSEKTVAANVLLHGTGGLNIDGCRIATSAEDAPSNHARGGESAESKGAYGDSAAQETHQTEGQKLGRWPANVLLSHSPGCRKVGTRQVERRIIGVVDRGDQTEKASQTYGAGTHGSKSEGTVQETLDAYDCEPDCPVRILDEQSGSAGQLAPMKATGRDRPSRGALGDMAAPHDAPLRDAPGGASRFFYTSKADNSERWGYCETCSTAFNRKTSVHEHPKPHKVVWHPTVKPVDLMQWLVRLVTPPGGLVLDPFAGTGTTGEAARLEGFDCVLIEQEAIYCEIIKARCLT